ncbi:MAG: hypothetical protein JSV43_07945 [Methanobacteriota archaeon]|nr:MAG: hypothetical protein JSV43_07945 [Euryarchaeota archaeon]
MNRLEKDRASAVDMFAVIVVVLVFITAGLGIMLYQISSEPPHQSPSIVLIDEQDIVEFEYVGLLWDTQKVFETTMFDAAVDNESYPKAVSFQWPYTNVFKPINLTITEGINPNEYVNFTGMIDGGKALEDELIGMREGESKSILLDSSEAFGDPDPALIFTLNLTETMDQVQVLTTVEFLERMGEVQIFVNATYSDPIWGWDVRIIKEEYVGGERELTIRNLPDEDQIVTPYETFESRVVSVESNVNEGKGEIVLEHLLGPEDVNNLMAKYPGGEWFLLVDIDEVAGTFVADFNAEKTGKTLLYEVTIVKVVKK